MGTRNVSEHAGPGFSYLSGLTSGPRALSLRSSGLSCEQETRIIGETIRDGQEQEWETP